MLVGHSTAMKVAQKIIHEVSKTGQPLLILGPPGSGKHLAARLVHEKSEGKSRPFIRLNGAALAQSLDHSDLFGASQEEGGQIVRRLGLLEQAAGGTLYLENLHEMPPTYQTFFLNLLSMGQARPPRGDTPFADDFRIIASAPDEEALSASGFRRDLLNLLKVFTLRLPPLSKRREDIPHLFTYFLETFCQEVGIEPPAIPQEIFDSIMAYAWQGNVAELKTAVKNLILLSPEGRLYAEYLPFEVRQHPFAVLEDKELPAALSEVERYLIHKALQRFAGNQTRAAHHLNISEAALRYKMRKYGLSKTAF